MLGSIDLLMKTYITSLYFHASVETLILDMAHLILECMPQTLTHGLVGT